MTRALAFVVHNWPLKLAAVVLASLLYAGLVLSRDAEVFQGRVPITPVDRPGDAVLIGDLRDVESIRYLAAPGVGDPVVGDFKATVDLSNVDPGAGPAVVKVTVTAVDPRINVISWSPNEVTVQLDPFDERLVPVRIDRGPVPNGMEVGAIEISPAEVTVSGPSSVVSQVQEVVATIALEPSGLDFQGEVEPVPVDRDGNALRPIDITPTTVAVTIPVFSDRQRDSLPIDPVVTGTPASGFRVAGVEVEPTVVAVEGDADDVAALVVADTQAVSVSGAEADVVRDVQLALPDGVRGLGVTTVRVTIRIASVTETRTLSAGIAVRGLSPGETPDLSSDRVLVTLFGSVAALDAAAASPLLASLDATGLGPGSHELPVVLVAPGLSVADISPPTVRITITTASPAPSAAP